MTTSATPQANESDPDAQIAAQVTDVEILPHSEFVWMWWGFKIVLNKPAAQCVDLVLDELEDHLLKHFHSVPANLIKAAVLIKKVRIKNVSDRSDDGGCSLVSPWILPVALAVARNNSGKDQNLWYTVWDPDKGIWGDAAEFNDNSSHGGPALAQHGDLLYCVHRGADLDHNLYWCVYSTNDGWSEDKKFTNQNCMTQSTPSLVEFKNKLYCFYKGPGQLDFLYSSSFDTATQTWSAGQIIKTGSTEHTSPSGCGVAVYNENELHMVYEANDMSHTLWHLYTTDGNTWQLKFHLTAFSTTDTPALVQYGNSLLMVHRGERDERLYYNFYNGSTWGNSESKIPDASGSGFATSTQGPGLAVFDGKVYMVHRSGQNTGELWYSVYDGRSWSHDTKIEDQSTGETPALATYIDPVCTPENYVDPNTAVPRLICVHRGWG